MGERHVVLSGCSGGGKSTLLVELRRRGHAVIEEPGRRIVQEETQSGGNALPWTDSVAFARRALAMAAADLAAATALPGLVFFDRCLVDAASALDHLGGQPMQQSLRGLGRYHSRVFLAPPWRALYRADAERRHGFEDAVAEFARLEQAFPLLGYRVVLLPQTDVAARADFVLAQLAG